MKDFVRRRTGAVWVLAFCLLALPAHAARLVSGVTALGVGADGRTPLGVAQSFPPDVTGLHAVADLADLPAGAEVEARWVAVDALETPDTVVLRSKTRLEQPGEARVHFSIELAEGKRFPAGRYRLEVAVNGEPAGSVPFRIAPRTGPGARPFGALYVALDLTPEGRPRGVTDELTADRKGWYGLATVDGLTAGQEVTGRWVYTGQPAAEGEVFAPQTVRIEQDGNQSIHFQVARNEGTWPEGWYRFEVFVDGELLAYEPFFVFPARGEPPAAPSPPADGSPAAGGGQTPRWAVFVYLDGDNNLEPFALKDLDEMERALPADGSVEVWVLVDRAEGYTEAEGNWTGARIYRVRPDPNEGIHSEVVAEAGELNMGDPATLRRFLGKGLAAVPARHRALILWDHGGGWSAHATDEKAPGAPEETDHLTLPELREALAGALEDAGQGPLDWVGFDMCLMAQMETAFELQGLARFVVASEAVEPGDGWPYERVLPLLARPELTPREAAAGIVDAFDASYRDREEVTVTLSALDLDRVGQAARALDALVGRIEQSLGAAWPALTRSLFFSVGFADLGDVRRGPKALASVDLGHAMANLARLSPAVGNSAEYRAFEEALGALVVRSRTSPRYRESRGVAVYAPFRKDLANPAYGQTRFARETRWAEVLAALHQAQARWDRAPRIDGIETVSLLRGEPVGEVLQLGQDGFRFRYEGANLLRALVLLGERDEKGRRTLLFEKSLLRRETLEDEGQAVRRRNREELLKVYSHPDGAHDVGFRYDALRHLLTDGERAFPVTVDETDLADAAAHVRSVPVLYLDPKYGKFFATVYTNWLGHAASVVVEVPQKDGSVVYAEVDPPPQAKVRPLLEALGDDGKVSYVPTGELAWGEGLRLTIDLVPPGSYEVLLGVETLTGRTASARHGFRVAVRDDDLLANREASARELTAENLTGEWEVVDAGAWFREQRLVPLGGFVTYRPHPRYRGVLEKVVSKPRGQDLYRGLHVVEVLRPGPGLPHMAQYVLDDGGQPRFDYGYGLSYPLFDRAGGRDLLLSLDLRTGELQVFVKRSGPPLTLSNRPQPAAPPPTAQPVSLDGVWQADDGTGLAIEGTQWVYFEAGQPVDQGVLQVEGDTITAQSLVTGTVMAFRFQIAGNRLVLQDQAGGITQYARVR